MPKPQETGIGFIQNTANVLRFYVIIFDVHRYFNAITYIII